MRIDGDGIRKPKCVECLGNFWLQHGTRCGCAVIAFRFGTMRRRQQQAAMIAAERGIHMQEETDPKALLALVA
ncbi:hypothetical protein WT71_19860 [Burkholderia stagnalis]|nr:hypothetical protein WT71_19860 [Burkholderia stagnalis]KWI71352.1 hypothetical protein WT73_00840 [Burkholderia stagnalis]